MNTTAAVGIEMAALFGGTMLIHVQRNRDRLLVDELAITGVRAGIAVLLLTVVLLIPVDIWDAEWPAYAGGVILLSSLIYEAGMLNNALDALLKQLRG